LRKKEEKPFKKAGKQVKILEKTQKPIFKYEAKPLYKREYRQKQKTPEKPIHKA